MPTNVKTPISGVVSAIEKQPGDAVAVDDAVILVECMKMYIPVTAPVAGTVLSIAVGEGETIAEDQLVFVIET